MAIIDHLKGKLINEAELVRPNLDFLKDSNNNSYSKKINMLVDLAIREGGLNKTNAKMLNDYVSTVYEYSYGSNIWDYFDKFDPNFRKGDFVQGSPESQAFNLLWDITKLHGAESRIAKLKKLQPKISSEGIKNLIDACAKKVEEFKDIKIFIQQVKENPIVRVSKKEVEKQEVTRKLLSNQGQMLEKVLDEFLIEMKEKVYENLKGYLNSRADEYLEKRKDEYESPRDYDVRMEPDIHIRRRSHQYGETLSGSVKRIPDGLKSKYDIDRNAIDKIAKNNADFVAEQFKAKNIWKLITIIDQKKGLSNARISNLSGGRGYAEGDMFFQFDDGSEFRVNNQIVTVWNSWPKTFNRFPTTFHDVKMPDGKFYKMVSEQWMIDNFKD